MRKLVVESKFYSAFPFHNLFKNVSVPLLDKWVAQAKSSADSGDFWVVVFRINHKGCWVVFDQTLISNFVIRDHVRYQDTVITDFESFFQDNKDTVFAMVQTAAA
jgi:hypothetical protein